MIKIHKVIPIIFILAAILLFLVTLLAPLISPYDPIAINTGPRLAPPSAAHLLGTDILGRDMFSRVLYGGRTSIILALVATCASLFLGFIIGVIAGYFGGAVDAVITNLTSVFQGIPGTCMMIAFVAMLGPGVPSLLFALTVTSWSGFSRIVRGEVMAVIGENYIAAAKGMGAGFFRIVLRYIVPNILPNLVVVFATKIAAMILSIAGLSFLGLGIQPPTPDWGVMVSEARATFRTAPMMLIAPGVCILLISLGINYGAELLREKLNVESGTLELSEGSHE